MPEETFEAEDSATQLDTAGAVILTFSFVACITMTAAFFAIRSVTGFGWLPLMGISGVIALSAAITASHSKTIRELVSAAFNTLLLLAYWT